MRNFIIAIAIILFTYNYSHSKELYVATNGNDSVSYADNNISNPWLTAEKGIKSPQPGDIVYFRSGSYTISSQITTGTNTRPMSEENRVIFSGYQNEGVTLSATIDTAIMIDVDYYTFKNMTITGTARTVMVANTYNAQYVKFENCVLFANGYSAGGSNMAVVTFNNDRAAYGEITNCHIYGLGWEDYARTVNTAGVFIFRSSGIKINNNIIHNLPRGIFYKHTCVGSDTGIEFKNNYIYDVYDGIVTVSQYTDIWNNIIVAHGRGIYIGEEGGLGNDGDNNGGDYNSIKNNTIIIRDAVNTTSVPMSIWYDEGIGPLGITVIDNIFIGSWNDLHRYSDILPNITLDYNIVPSTTAVYHNNTPYTLAGWKLFFGGDANSIAGIPTFQVGTPTEINDFELSVISIGKNESSIGGDIGALVSYVGIEGSEPIVVDPVVEILTASGQTTAASVFTITGTATADTGQTISGVTCSGQTVMPDDGTWDEQAESFTCLASLTLGENTLLFIGSDGTRTGQDSIAVTRIKKTSKINGSATIKNATIHQ